MIIDQVLYDKTSFGSAKKILCSCDKCNKELYVAKQKLVQRNNRTYCRECAITKHGKSRQQIDVVCKACNHAFTKRHDTLFSWAGLCAVCSQKEVTKMPHVKEARRLNGIKSMKNYGHLIIKRGADSPMWNGGITTEIQKIRGSVEQVNWSKNVLIADNYTCQVCKVRGGKLCADHILPFSLYPQFRTEPTNGRTLCVSCHTKYGARVWGSVIKQHAQKLTPNPITYMFMTA